MQISLKVGGLLAGGLLGLATLGANAATIEDWLSRKVARSDDVAAEEVALRTNAAPHLSELRQPIDEVFAAWRTLDAKRYMEQWHPDAVRSSKRYKRMTRDQMETQRAEIFSKLVSVKEKHEVCYFGPGEDGKTQIVYVRYDMTLHWKKDNEIVRDTGTVERYDLVHSQAQGRWFILRNSDSRQVAPCRFPSARS